MIRQLLMSIFQKKTKFFANKLKMHWMSNLIWFNFFRATNNKENMKLFLNKSFWKDARKRRKLDSLLKSVPNLQFTYSQILSNFWYFWLELDLKNDNMSLIKSSKKYSFQAQLFSYLFGALLTLWQ